MEFSILGPLAVRVDGTDVAPTAGKPRALLVRLLVAGGRPVAADRLIEDLWDGEPPRSGAQTLQTYVLQLRKQLGADRLVTDRGGYRVVMHDGELDTERFEKMLTAGRSALGRGSPQEAIVAFDQALRLWRGEPLVDAAGASWAAGEAARLDELRLVALEQLLGARLIVGDNAEVAAAAEAGVATHPLRERLWSHLITALYRQGRQADALRAFQRLRGHLADELGIDPSPELRELEQAVLEQDPRLDVAPAITRQPQPTHPTELPSGLVTFLLTDIAGSTRMWDTVPKLMPDALALHDDAIRDAVESHGGVVLKARGEGDSAFAVFRRATDAAAAAVAAQRALAVSDWPEGCALSVRMAIHTGEALERDGDYYGPTVNRASRLRGVAEGGQVVVSHATAAVIVDHLGPELHVVELGRHQLRDLERPEIVYLLVDGAAPSTSGVPRSSSVPALFEQALFEPPPLASALTASGPFVGREAEIEGLTVEWTRARQGTPRVVMLGGEAGVGKTRLAAEMARLAHSEGAVVLYGRCDEDLGVPYEPFAEGLRALLFALDAPRLRSVRGIDELLRLVPEVADIVPDLRAPTHSDPETERYALFDTVARLLVAVSKQRPILLVLDDLHWAAKPTLLMLRHILRFGDGAAVELLGTYRTTDLDPAHPLAGMLADLHREGTIERVMLGGLDESDVNAFLEATGREDEELARTLSAVTSGNPFFLIEVLHHVDETGGEWDPNTLPQGVREAVGRRLTRLTDLTRDALLAGAVVGPRFSLEVVEKVLDRDLVDAVAEACDRGILREEPGGYFHFSHALVRQSLLTGVASVKRVRLHQRVAETLESAGADRDEYVADLAHHYFESAWAGNAPKAVEYCRRAANQAMDRLAYEGAAELFERALQALDIDEPTDRARIRAELLLARCEALLAAGDAVGASAAVADLEAVAGASPHLSAWVACFTAELAVLTRPDQLHAMERRVAAAAGEFAALDDPAGEAVAHNTRAACLARLGRFADCEVALDRALVAARRSAGSAASATAADNRRVNAVLAGAPVAALWGPNPAARAGGRCLDVIRLLRITTGSPAVEATSVRCQAMLEAFRGRWPAARRMLDSARRSLTQLGLRHALLEVDLYAGIVELIAEAPEAAVPPLRRAYDGFRRMGLDAGAAEAAALLARARLALGQHDEADELCVESERLGGQDLRASIAWRTVRAQLLASRGDQEQAREIAEAAVALAEPTDALVDKGDAFLALALVLEAAEDGDGAGDAAERAVRLYERKGASALAERARKLVGSSSTHVAENEPDRAFERRSQLPGDGSASGVPEPRRRAAGMFPVADNVAAVAHTRFHAACAIRDWATVEALLADDIVSEDRAQLRWQGRAAVIDAMRGAADVGVERYDCTTIATRGSRLALTRVRGSGRDQGPTAPALEVLAVVEVDGEGRIIAVRLFDDGDLYAAHVELDARYLAGEGAPYADTVGLVLEAVSQARDWQRTVGVYADDMTFVDHRPAAFGVIRGRRVREVIPRQWADEAHALEIEAVDDGVALVLVHAREAAPGSVEAEWAFHVLNAVDRGLVTRIELFDADDRAGALAAFEDVRRSARRPRVAGNHATATLSRLQAACLGRDWVAAEHLYAQAALGHDRRAGIRTITEGPEAAVAELRFGIEMGVTRYDATTIATRGDRLALTRLWCGSDQSGSPAVELLYLVETNSAGSIETTVAFDLEDLDAAFAELDARYAAGEAAPFAGTWTAIVDAYVRFNAGGGTPPRPAIELMGYEDVPGIEARVTAVHRLADGVALLTARASAPDTDAWDSLVLLTPGGRGGAWIEAYDLADLDVALARFDELAGSG